jgi:poly(A) polymerase
MSLLKQIDPSLLSGADEIVGTLRSSGFEALFAGGVVRDLLLGRPVADIDIATSACPEEIEKLFEHTIPIGRDFGVVVVVVNSVNYEVTTFRTDRDYVDGRHPEEVLFSGAEEDALRRDFTVNGLFLDPFTEQVIDLVEGRKDLERRVIKTVGSPSRRFSEDRLRLIRAIRFASELDFQIEEQTLQELKRNAQYIQQVSYERIRDEIVRIVTCPSAHHGLQMLFDTGILEVILPEVAATVGLAQPPEFHPEGDVFSHTVKMLELVKDPTDTLALGILLHDVGKVPTFTVKERIRFDGHAEVGAEMARDICRRFRLPNTKIAQIVDLVKNHLRFIHVREMKESTLKRFLRKENFAEHLELHRLDCLASHGDLSNYDFCTQNLEEYSQEVIRPKPLISGYDLIELGLVPGPIFSEILTAVEDSQLEGRLESRSAALDWVRERWIAKKNGGDSSTSAGRE